MGGKISSLSMKFDTLINKPHHDVSLNIIVITKERLKMDFIAIGTVVVLFVGIFFFPASNVKKTQDKLVKIFESRVSHNAVIDIEELKDKLMKNRPLTKSEDISNTAV